MNLFGLPLQRICRDTAVCERADEESGFFQSQEPRLNAYIELNSLFYAKDANEGIRTRGEQVTISNSKRKERQQSFPAFFLWLLISRAVIRPALYICGGMQPQVHLRVTGYIMSNKPLLIQD
jgi:hypothetical protein